MKVYQGHRVLTPDHPTRGIPTVIVHEVLGQRPASIDDLLACECLPLTIVTHHSPTGVEWGYAGSGPADLALSVLADYFGETPQQVTAALRSLWAPRSKAAALHQRFKDDFLAWETRDQWQIRGDIIEVWLQAASIQELLAHLADEDEKLAEIRQQDAEAEEWSC